MKTPTVSILMCTYNCSQYVDKTLRNIQLQTFDDYEMLIFDDLSSDNTSDILRLRAGNDHKIKVFRDVKRGPYGGLNLLLEKAKGHYVAVQDHDDLWLPDKLQIQVSFLQQHLEYEAAGSSAYYYDEARERFLLYQQEKGAARRVYHTSLIYRNRGLRYDPKCILPDENFITTLSRNRKLYRTDEALIVRRIRRDGENLSRSRFRFNSENLKQFYRINGVDPIYLLDLLSRPYRPAWLERWISPFFASSIIDRDRFLSLHPYLSDQL